MQESVDHEMSKMLWKTLAQFLGFPVQSLFCQRDIADETGQRRERLELGKAQNIGRLVDLPPIAVKDALVRVVRQQNRDLGSADDAGLRLLQGLVDGGFRDAIQTVEPVAGFNVEGDFERGTRAQEALSSLAVAPS